MKYIGIGPVSEPMEEPFVVIGGDAAGMSAASKAKRDDPDRDVIAFERGSWVSYAACGMPYFVKGDVETLDDLVQITPETFREERNIDIRTNHEVVGIDPDAQSVTVDDGTETFEQAYGDLLIATGARAVEPPIDGIDLDGVFTLHHMDDAAIIDENLESAAVEQAVVVGGGYVGVEVAEALAAHDIEVHMVEMLEHILQPFGEGAARVVEAHLETAGVTLHLETAVDRLEGDGSVERVIAGERALSADLVVVGVGVAPNAELAEEAGIERGETGAIATDEYGQTNVPNVYAAGDCAEATNVVTGNPDWVPLALTANRAGRAIGQTVTGTPTPVGGITGTAIVKAFDLGVARTGVLDATRAREAGFEPVSVEIQAPSRAHYYPGATELTVTMVADAESRRVLGASIAGREGVKRIDTVATALHAGMTVDEVEALDLAYAPPFSPTWDPVATVAKVLAGKLD